MKIIAQHISLSTFATITLPTIMSLFNKKCDIGGQTCNLWIVKVDNDQFMYKGHAVANILGYKKPRNALAMHVKPNWRKTWEEIHDTAKHRLQCKSALNQGPHLAQAQLPVNWHPHTVFISEAGVYALIMRSKLPAAEEFQQWLFEEVLPELRKTGTYSVNNDPRLVTVAEYKKLADAQIEALQLKLELSKNEIAVSEMKRNYEHQMNEYKERQYKMQLVMKDMATQANMSMTQFAVNALLAKDNIEENGQLRQTLTDISGRVVPAMTEQPEKEEYITGYERMVNGKRRIRVCRSQLHEIEQQDKAIQRYREDTNKHFKPSRRYAWLHDSEKFLQLKCPNPVMVWLKVRSVHPHLFFGLRYTNKLKTEMEVLDEAELRAKYRTNVEMCKRNRNIHFKQIEEFKSLGLVDEDDCVAKCLTPSVDAKERINTIVEGIVEDMNKELVPTTPQRRHSNAGETYTAEQVVHTMNNCQNFFVKNVFNVRFYNCSEATPKQQLALDNSVDDSV
ncbi:BRO-2 [Spodoptera litura nucleopolyhedrovirus II]|uniref:BRO-2 n=1 Tax=Spodoptera litura nucleopolyhedrovirus II TaxID=566270 RepID=UPI000187465C|nr:BRO-2 [Spodoptera litura nucleopolyhedrovirus II]ACI47506.1 BRO-2 [Spodoptera litura nucleopolyhedrovirus II]